MIRVWLSCKCGNRAVIVYDTIDSMLREIDENRECNNCGEKADVWPPKGQSL